MALVIELSPEVQRRLEEQAAQRRQAPAEYARLVLEEQLAAAGHSQSPDEMLAAFLASHPHRGPEDLLELARRQGVSRVKQLEDLLGEGPAPGDTFDVDSFLAARKRWHRECGPPDSRLAEPEDARR